MNPSQPPVLEFPAMLHGQKSTVLRQVALQGKAWAREYLKTGVFTPPQRMLQVAPGAPLVMHAGLEFDFLGRASWRVHIFRGVFLHLHEGLPDGERTRALQAFESFCLSTPWGALHRAVCPSPPWSAKLMAERFAALLRFWDVLQGPCYAYWVDRPYTLEELVEYIYGRTLRAWYPESTDSVREHLELTVERMARATREERLEAVLRVMPVLIETDAEFKHRERLSDPGFLRERLTALPVEEFESLSSADRFAVTTQLAAWDRELGRQ